MWTVIERKSRQFITFIVSKNRDAEAAKQVWENTQEVVSPLLVCSDYWSAYSSVIPSELHVQSKKQTQTIESINGVIRLFVKRFNRKTRCYSKSDKMIEASLRLFFHFWNFKKQIQFNII